MISRNNMVKDDLTAMTFLGVVVDPVDPLLQGRCKIRVFGKFDELSDEDLPWANPELAPSFAGDGRGGAISVPRRGTVVSVYFDAGNIYSPLYSTIQELSDELIDELRGSYENAHSWAFDKDEQLKVFYTKQKGFTISLKDSRINIANDNAITIEHRGTSSIIELRGNNITITSDSEVSVTGGSRVTLVSPEVWANGRETKVGHVPAYSAVLAEPLFAFLKALSNAVDAKLYPTPSAMADLCEQAERLATSDTVKVSK